MKVWWWRHREVSDDPSEATLVDELAQHLPSEKHERVEWLRDVRGQYRVRANLARNAAGRTSHAASMWGACIRQLEKMKNELTALAKSGEDLEPWLPNDWEVEPQFRERGPRNDLLIRIETHIAFLQNALGPNLQRLVDANRDLDRDGNIVSPPTGVELERLADWKMATLVDAYKKSHAGFPPRGRDLQTLGTAARRAVKADFAPGMEPTTFEFPEVEADTVPDARRPAGKGRSRRDAVSPSDRILAIVRASPARSRSMRKLGGGIHGTTRLSWSRQRTWG
jgi:hypothetical protein